ncbi:MAG: hypothetical protein IJK21_04780 [Prevotella sp.]|nr:hypothetical protein [Prevotella sp.]
MKKFYMILGAALMMSSAMFAQHTIDEYKLTATDVTIDKPGDRGNLVLSIESPDVLANASFRLYFPDGIVIAKDYDEDMEEDVYVVGRSSDLLKPKHKKNISLATDGSTVVALYEDVDGEPFKAASGTLLTMTLEAASDIAEGTYEATIKNIDMDNLASNLMQINGWTDKIWEDVTFTITVGTPTGIDTIEAAEDWNAPVYDLNGRMINGKPAQKGVYIKNGKKVVVK